MRFDARGRVVHIINMLALFVRRRICYKRVLEPSLAPLAGKGAAGGQTPQISMRVLTSTLLVLLSLGLGCPATSQPVPGGPQQLPSSQPADLTGTSPTSAGAPTQQLVPPAQIAPDRRVWAYIDGVRRAMDIDDARSLGFTIIDLSDDWVPYIFWPRTPGKDDYKPNQYLATYIDLANDRIDVDGNTLQASEHNYLEVYGIPPTLSVLRRRVLQDEQTPCLDKLDRSLFHDYHGPVRAADEASSRRLRQLYLQSKAAYVQARREARVATLEQLLALPAYASVAKNYQRYRWRYHAIDAMKQRLACEEMYGRRGPRVKPGEVNWAVRQALRRFERKHNIYGWGIIYSETAAALGRSALENDFEALKRVIVERVVNAAGVLEDGSVTDAYRDTDGKTRQVRDLVGELGDAALRHLGLTNATRGIAFLKAHTEQNFAHMLVGVQLPPVPSYYSDHMDVHAVIDRGDVWYDLPFNAEGKRLPQPRQSLPTFTLYVSYANQNIPLVRWRTTIGGWQEEKRGDEVYYKYKVSDVGPRIWKNIVAGPVWVPPKNSPTWELVKIRGERVVAQSTFGPGYASAYGLVAAFHVREDDGFDNQIRTHGTVNYMSVRAGFSHGCHRLYNYQAVRLFSFLLRHRDFVRKGQYRLAYEHRFEHKGEDFQINLHTRGYYYELTPPVHVDVTEGRIRGTLKEPVEEYVKKPSEVYQEDLPSRRTLNRPSVGSPRTHPREANPLRQHQTL